MSKNEADDCKKIEIWWLLQDIKERGCYKSTTVSWGENGSAGSIGVKVSIWGKEKYVQFSYAQTDNQTDEKKDFDYKVPLVETVCHFGGTRYWFQCSLFKNGKHCGRRVGVLYKGGDWFGCRHCYELAYSSQKLNRRDGMYSLFRVLDTYKKIDKLSEKAKRYSYGGELTKKQQRIAKLQGEAFYQYRHFQDAESAREGRNKTV